MDLIVLIVSVMLFCLIVYGVFLMVKSTIPGDEWEDFDPLDYIDDD